MPRLPRVVLELRADALEHGPEFAPEDALDLFLDYLGITEEQFHDIVKLHEVRPHETPACGDCQRCQTVPWDAEQWSRVTGDPSRDAKLDAAGS